MIGGRLLVPVAATLGLLLVASACSPCRLLLNTGSYAAPRDRLERSDDTLFVRIHEFSPDLVTPERFNPHGLQFNEEASDFDRRPPVLAIESLLELTVESERPVPEDVPPLERDVELGLPAGEVSRDRREAVREVEFAGETFAVTFTVERESRRMQMYRIPYLDARLPETEGAPGEEPVPGEYRAWITGPPEAWRVRNVTLRVRVTASLPDVLAGYDDSERNPDELVQTLERAATPVFRELYRDLVLPASQPEAATDDRREAGDYAADRLERRLEEQRAAREAGESGDDAGSGVPE